MPEPTKTNMAKYTIRTLFVCKHMSACQHVSSTILDLVSKCTILQGQPVLLIISI